MIKSMFQISPGFEDIMPAEYLELIENGPFEKRVGVSDLGDFKELLEEHPPLCRLRIGTFIATDIGLSAKPRRYDHNWFHRMQCIGFPTGCTP